MKKVAIAGINGFLGKYLQESLNSNFYNVYPIDLSYGIDMSKWQDADKIPTFDVFVHLANMSYVPDSYVHPLDFYTINYLTTLHALELCRRYNAKLVYISSYVYGNPQYLPVDEKHPRNPFNPYAQTKCLAEDLCKAYNRDFGVISTILRPFNIFGPYQKGNMLIPTIISQLKQGEMEIHLRDPNPRRDYVYVQDVADAIKRCIDHDFDALDVFNVCSGNSLSVREMTECINTYMDNKIQFVFGSSDRPSEVSETIGTYDKIRSAIGWQPNNSFADGINKIISQEIYNK